MSRTRFGCRTLSQGANPHSISPVPRIGIPYSIVNVFALSVCATRLFACNQHVEANTNADEKSVDPTELLTPRSSNIALPSLVHHCGMYLPALLFWEVPSQHNQHVLEAANPHTWSRRIRRVRSSSPHRCVFQPSTFSRFRPGSGDGAPDALMV